jgi:type IV secretory pathway VirB10-like protein
MTIDLRPKNGGVDPVAPARELGARRRNFRPWLLIAALVVLAIGLIKIEYLIPWWEPDRTPRIEEPEPAYDVAALTGFTHPALTPNTIEVPKLIDVPRDVIKTQIETEQLPAPEVHQREFEVEPVQFSGMIAYKPTEPTPSYMLDGRRPVEAWGCAIRAGVNVIHATFNDDVRWDMGGPISATVTENVYSYEALARGEKRTLIPAGATLVGVAADPTQLKRGMDLAAGPTWTEVNFTDTTGITRSINLFDAAGAGAGGINGIGGEVDARWRQLILASVFYTVLDVISSININVNTGGDSGDTVSSASMNVGGSSAASIGQEVVKSILDWRPIILTKKGTAVTVKPIRAVRVC